MKKFVLALQISGILAMFLSSSCKKNSIPKDYTASIKDKSWWGTLTYTGKAAEYYSVHFNADSSLLWSQLSGDYTGQWAVSGRQLTMTFPGIGATVKADISDNDTLRNISDDNNTFTINTGELTPYPNMLLDNTVWNGTLLMGNAIGIQLDFRAGLRVLVKIGSSAAGFYNYKRSASGAAIQFDFGGSVFFGVITSGNAMKGSNGLPQYPWQVTRQ